MSKAFELKKIYYEQNSGGLPAGYRRVEYLQSTGAQYIDTGRTLAARATAVIEQDLDFASLGVRNYTISSYRSSGTGGKMIAAQYTVNDYANIWQRSATTFTGDVKLTSTRHVYTTLIDSNVAMKADGVAMAQMERFIYSNYTTYPFKLFTDGRSGTYGGQKHYYTRMIVDGVVVRSYAPAVREADNKPGLYDLCGSICLLTDSPFYVNSGTGADFTWGELQ